MQLAKSILVCILTCSACAHPARPASEAKSEAEPLLDGFVRAISTSDKPAMERLFADDAVVIGLPGCKGKPCVGKANFRDRYLAIMLGAHPWEARVTRRERDRVWADWTTELAIDNVHETLRGSLSITAANGRIARLVFFYDVANPTTILRRSQTEIVFALQEPDGFRDTTARVVLTRLDEAGHDGNTHTGVAVYLHFRGAVEETSSPADVAAAVHRGTCKQLGPSAYALDRFGDGRSDTLLAVTMDSLVAEHFSVVLRARDGSLLACGDIPQQTWTRNPKRE